MTLKKGIKLLDLWIEHRENALKELQEKVIFSDLEITKVLVKADQRVIENLKLIKKEIVPNCKHPKNMQDTCKGQKYCMDCNMDL